MPEFNRLKTEKEAKKLEPEVSGFIKSENKSVVRAVARFVATTTLYPEMTNVDRADALVKAFYVDAKFQPSWEPVFAVALTKYPGIESLISHLKENLGTPQARGRRRKETSSVLVNPPDVPDVEAVLGPPPIQPNA